MSNDVTTSKSWLQNLLPNDWGALSSAFAAAYGVGLLSLIALPFTVGANMSSLGLDEAQAGLLSTLEFIGVFVTSVLLAPRVAKINRRTVAFAGAAIVVLANLACAAFGSHEMLMVLRPIAGLGAGLALATGNATVANADQPEKFAGYMTGLFVVLMFIITQFYPSVAESNGQTGLYLALAITVAVLSPLLFFLPPNAPAQSFVAEHSTDRGRVAILSTGGIMVLLAFFAFSLRDTMSWAFLASTGMEAGLSEERVGTLIGNSALVGLIGPLVAMLMGARFGLRLPLVVGIVASGLVTYGISQSSTSAQLYSFSVMFWVGTYFFCLSYLTALAAEIDVEGRVVAASGSALMIGLAVGPSFGGALIADGSYTVVGHVNNVLIVVTLVGALLAYQWAKKALAAAPAAG
ncbi:MAG: MFS transporter [Confluentimicrobium sp.]|nr:MFS transporter [Actibacterium sp.]|tara:strand:+ start:1251 stop:2468 length:1218 start_codon:yes stop_codon:yes gene_type:complete